MFKLILTIFIIALFFFFLIGIAGFALLAFFLLQKILKNTRVKDNSRNSLNIPRKPRFRNRASFGSLLKGSIGEKMTSFVIWSSLDRNIYHRIDNVIIPSQNGTTQIDHIVISVYGIFVIETKNIKGWIFGAPESDKWAQVIYGNTCQFQNPIKQNYRHTKCLSEYLHLDHDVFKPIVFFVSRAQFKTEMPQNVLNRGLTSYIKQFREIALTQQEVEQVNAVLLSLKGDLTLTNRTHLQSLQKRYDSTTQCPRCGAALVNRTSRNGHYAGIPFLGCSRYPECKYIKDN